MSEQKNVHGKNQKLIRVQLFEIDYGSWLVIAFIIIVVLFNGNPDIADAIICWLSDGKVMPN